MSKIILCEAAALHLIQGFIKPQDVPVGEHKLDDLRVTFTIPIGCSVIRDKGNSPKEDGFTYPAPYAPQQSMNLSAALLFIKRTHKSDPEDAKVWAKCLNESLDPKNAVPFLLPPEAAAALQEINAKLLAAPKVKGQPSRTQAKRNGTDRITVEYETLGGKALRAK